MKIRKRYEDRKDRGVVKSLIDISVKKVRRTRRNCKKNSQTYRNRQKGNRNILTPLNSPTNEVQDIPLPTNRSETMNKAFARKEIRQMLTGNWNVKVRCEVRLT